MRILFFSLCVVWCGNVLAQVPLEDRNGDGEIRVLAFGDSITFGVGDGVSSGETVVTAPILPGVLGYPGRVEVNLSTLVDNGGVPGELLTEEGIFRFSAVLSAKRADYVLIMEGSNDSVIQVNPSKYEAKLQALVNIARVKGVEPILLTLTPTCCDRAGPLPILQGYSSIVRDVGGTNDVPVADIEVAFDMECPILEICPLLNRPEGLHPNTEGYDLIGKVVSELILGEPLPTPTPVENGGMDE